MQNPTPSRIVMGITGASGAPYGRALLRRLVLLGYEVHLVVSRAAIIVMREEMGLRFPADTFNLSTYLGEEALPGQVILYDERDLAAGPASGSFRHSGMVICPCSMKTLANVATGTGQSLITRAADSCLKERRRLVVVPRETPLSLIHLRNMVSITEAGAVVLPAMPGFYAGAKTVEDLIDHLCLKILDSLGLDHNIDLRWKDR